MRNDSVYCPGDSFVHRAHPLTKLYAVPLAVISAFALPWPATWVLSFALLAAAFALDIGGTVLRRYLVLALPFVLALFVFHGLILDRPDFRPLDGWPGWLPDFSPAGVRHAAVVGGRISLMLAISLLFVATTHPAMLLQAFDAANWPPALSFLLASPLLLLDQFAARVRAIRDAQQTRGLDVDGSLRVRFSAIRALIVPLVTLALADVNERAHVLTARGFRALPRRSVLDPPADDPRQRLIRRLLLVLCALEAGYLLWRQLPFPG